MKTNKTPEYYTQGDYQPILVNRAWSNSNFEVGNILKYINRAGKKGGESKIKDLRKVLDYLDLLQGFLDEGFELHPSKNWQTSYHPKNVCKAWQISGFLEEVLYELYNLCSGEYYSNIYVCKKNIEREIQKLEN